MNMASLEHSPAPFEKRQKDDELHESIGSGKVEAALALFAFNQKWGGDTDVEHSDHSTHNKAMEEWLDESSGPSLSMLYRAYIEKHSEDHIDYEDQKALNGLLADVLAGEHKPPLH
jgi:hypothetical protein